MDDLTIDARKQELLEARFLGLPKVKDLTICLTLLHSLPVAAFGNYCY